MYNFRHCTGMSYNVCASMIILRTRHRLIKWCESLSALLYVRDCVGWSRWYHWCLKFFPLPEGLLAIFSITALFYKVYLLESTLHSTVWVGCVCIPFTPRHFCIISSLWIFFLLPCSQQSANHLSIRVRATAIDRV